MGSAGGTDSLRTRARTRVRARVLWGCPAAGAPRTNANRGGTPSTLPAAISSRMPDGMWLNAGLFDALHRWTRPDTPLGGGSELLRARARARGFGGAGACARARGFLGLAGRGYPASRRPASTSPVPSGTWRYAGLFPPLRATHEHDDGCGRRACVYACAREGPRVCGEGPEAGLRQRGACSRGAGSPKLNRVFKSEKN
jgi:hypothetical protein